MADGNSHKYRLTRLQAFVIVVLIWAGVYLPYLGTARLKGEECRRALPAVRMLETGNWIQPYMGGLPYYKKPPGINWLVGLSFLITAQESVLSARLPSVVFVLAFVSWLIWSRSVWLDVGGRLMGAVIFLTSMMVIEHGRLIEIEAVYTCLTGMAILDWLNTYSRKGSAWRLWLIPSLILCYGMLTKGPIILLVFYCTTIAVLAYARELRKLLSWPHVLAVLVVFLVPLGWAYLAARQGSPEDMSQTMLTQQLSRLSLENVNFGKWGREILDSFMGFLPWTLFVPVLWQKRFVSRIPADYQNVFRACRLGVVVSFVAIILMPQMVERYCMPVLAPASVVLGWALSRGSKLGWTDRLWRNLVLAAFVLSSISAVVCVIAVDSEAIAFAVMVLTIAVTHTLIRNRKALDSIMKLGVLTGVLVVAITVQHVVFTTPLLAGPEPGAVVIDANVPAGEKLYMFFDEDGKYHNFMFHIQRPVQYIDPAKAISPEVRYLLIKERDWFDLRVREDVAGRPVRTMGKFSSRGKRDFRLIELR